MNLQTVIDALRLAVLTQTRDFSAITPHGAYLSDLLSCAMAGAKKDMLWITLQAHVNVVAVASLTKVAAVIITENAPLEKVAILKADEQGVILLSTPKTNYEISGALWEFGIR